MRQLKPAIQYSEGRTKPWSGARVLNCFAERSDGDKGSEYALMAIPGLDLFTSITENPVRGSHVMDGIIYAVVGITLYSIDQGGATTQLGQILGTGPVRMADNGSEVAICAAPTGYVYSGGTVHIPSDLPEVSDVAYIDGYFVWTILDSDQAIYSGINDGLSYDGLDVFSAEGAPDGLKGLINDHRELQMFGGGTIEIFFNAGGDDAFVRQGNAFIERGCFDRDSIAKIDNSVHFLGDDRIVYRLDGYSPIRISTHAEEYLLRNVTYARAFVYTQEGHKFYCLTTDTCTMCYDMATGLWHNRQSWNLPNYRVGGAVQAWGGVYMTDAYSGNFYRPNLDSYTENGDPISVQIDLPTITAARERVTCYAFEAYCESGVGLNEGQGANPQIMLRYSKDGGRTYSNEMWRSLGKIGEYLARAVWRSLGQFRQLNIRLTMTDPVRRFVMSYWADVR